ncbi:MAG: Small subunit (SSU) processome component [Peltula sp. TS41687]|nr:MAG: Small subunit (SSU) processome component [Peltula sp. TS41687]
MVRKLKHHEQKLLRKVSFTTYPSRAAKTDQNSHRIIRRYHIQSAGDYNKYNRLCGSIKQLAHRLTMLDPSDPVRRRHETLLLEKLWSVGVLGAPGEGGQGGRLSEVENKVSVAAFCRRRLPVVMMRGLKMCETVQAGVRFIEQGHVRVGTEVVTDPAFLVTRNMEDFVTWVDSSKIKRNILRYRDKLDDFDLL